MSHKPKPPPAPPKVTPVPTTTHTVTFFLTDGTTVAQNGLTATQLQSLDSTVQSVWAGGGNGGYWPTGTATVNLLQVTHYTIA